MLEDPDDTAHFNTYFSFKQNASTQNWRIGLHENNASYAQLMFGSQDAAWSNFRVASTPIEFTGSGNWHYVIVTYNGSGATTIGNYSCRIDGSAQTLTTAGAFGS